MLIILGPAHIDSFGWIFITITALLLVSNGISGHWDVKLSEDQKDYKYRIFNALLCIGPFLILIIFLLHQYTFVRNELLIGLKYIISFDTIVGILENIIDLYLIHIKSIKCKC